MQPKHITQFDRRLEELVEAARAAQPRAQSYRRFKVGAAVLATNGRDYQVFVGVNLKPAANAPKICAEQVAVGAAIANGFQTIVGMVVIGEPQTEEQPTLTLHPCYICQNILAPLHGFSGNTIVVTEQASNGRHRERHTFRELIALHGPHIHD